MGNPLRYIASSTLAGISFGLVLLVAILQSLCTWKWGAKYMLAMVIGGYTFAIGLATRFALNDNPRSKGTYIAMYLFVVLSPCAFIAATYVLLGRFARHLKCDELLLVSPRYITRIFITSDVVTFLVQAAGGGVSAGSTTVKMAKIGSRIFLAGLALQLLSYLIFITVYITFLVRIRTRRPEVWNMDKELGTKWFSRWKTLAGAFMLSCIGILVRSIFRTIELGEGYAGYLATHEVYFYTLDTLPLFIAISIFVPFWPGRFIREESSVVENVRQDKESTDSAAVGEKEGAVVGEKEVVGR